MLLLQFDLLFLLDQSSSLKDAELPIFDLATVIASTINFSPANELGKGSFGIVYRVYIIIFNLSIFRENICYLHYFH
jgi:hypothetical protein